MSAWCDSCTKRATRRILASSGAFPNSYYCEECYEKRLSREPSSSDFCGDHQLAHGPHEFIRGARRYDCPGCPPPESSR